MKQKIIIRADGGANIGMGHVIRCLALADMLKNDFSIVFAIQEPSESVVKNINTITETILHLPTTNDYSTDASNFCEFLEDTHIVVLDGYNFKTDYQQTVINTGAKLVVIDDLHSWHHLANAIINHAAGISENNYSKEKNTNLFSGLDYVLLRKPFLNPSSDKRKITSVKKVFISMGAADITNLTSRFTEALIQIKEIEEIHLMLGSINPNIASIDKLIENNKQIKIKKHFDISAEQLAVLLKSCDVAICPASTISLESCAIGIGLISGYTAENQKGILQGLVNNKAAIDLGDLNLLNVESIICEIKKLKVSELTNTIENQKKLIDGDSPKRILSIFKSIHSEKIHFRFAENSDVELYYKWTNDPIVRSNSYNHSAVEHESHIKWFEKKLNSPDCFLYLFLNEKNTSIGQVRIEKVEKETVIGISIDSAHRGKGFATKMLEQASKDYLQKHPTEKIIAYIKIENKSSYTSFVKAGYGSEEIVTEQGFKSYKLVKK